MAYKESDEQKKLTSIRPFPEEGIGRFSERLTDLIGSESLRSFSRKVGISDGTLRKYLSDNTEPSLSRLAKIAYECNVNLEWLATGQGPKELQPHIVNTNEASAQEVSVDEFNEEYALIPGYHVAVSTGHGVINGDEPVKRHLAFRKKWLNFRKLNANNLAVVFAKGDSMEPTIHNGNTLLVDLSDQKLTEGSIFVLRLGDDLYAKRLQQRFDGSVELISDNKEYNNQIVPKDELAQLDIIGKVVWIGKDLY